ncbi:hypothetical protein BASA81_010057 [Batrachochytrium salamandrivorans]|nr:hypothetical protein BASA81_010057 [Batrachochytrium salamandrivorans]
MLRSSARLELELEELRRDFDRLKREEAVWRSRAELSDKKAARCEQDTEAARTLSLELECTILALKQQNHQSEQKLKRGLNDLEEQFSLEREAWEQAVQSAEKRAEEARNLERQQTLKVQAYEQKLEVMQNTPAKKRHRSDSDSDDEEGESDVVFDLKLRVRELEVENLALSKGVAVTQRTQQLAEELQAKDAKCRQLESQLDSFKSFRRTELEQESNAELLQVQFQALKTKYNALQEFATLKDSILHELAQWKRVLPTSVGGDAATPQDATKAFAEFQHKYSTLAQQKNELALALQEAGKHNDVLASQAALVEDLERKLESALGRAKQMEIERDATERVLNSVPLTGEGAEQISLALTECREELRQAQLQIESLQREIQCSIGSHAGFDPQHTRILRVKPALRADHVLLQAQQKQQALLRTAEKHRPPAGMFANPPPPTPDGFSVDKHNARLKEMFQKQIRLFKEAVFLLFGWKIEMTPDEQRPVLKLKSMFAESAEDVLMFRMNPSNSQLDLLGSDFAKTLGPTMLAYLHRFQSPPGFISFLTLELFNKQTRM